MKKNDFEKFLSLQGLDLYSFGYILIPDDLQAGQLAVDSVSYFLISHKNELEKLFKLKIKDLDLELLNFRREMFKNIYDIAKKRYSQIKLSISFTGSEEIFHRLDFDEKAVIYLYEKTKISIEDIALITNKSKAESLAYLNSARNNLIKEIPFIQKAEAVQ